MFDFITVGIQNPVFWGGEGNITAPKKPHIAWYMGFFSFFIIIFSSLEDFWILKNGYDKVHFYLYE